MDRLGTLLRKNRGSRTAYENARYVKLNRERIWTACLLVIRSENYSSPNLVPP